MIALVSNPRIPAGLSGSTTSLPPLNGRSIIANVVVNVECWRFDAPMPRKLLGSPHGRENIPDIPNFSWVEYGMRAGLPRLIREFSERGIPVSASMNAAITTVYPDAAEAIRTANWEFVGHGMAQRALPSVEDEASEIEETLDLLEGFTGSRPRGWLGPGLAETMSTPDVLSEAGVDYVRDWVVDDVPLWLEATPRRLVAIPYTLELNDSVLYAAQWHPAEEYDRRLAATLELFEEECTGAPRILTIALHPHLVGVPHRIGALRTMMDRLQASPNVAFANGSEICDWFVGAQDVGD